MQQIIFEAVLWHGLLEKTNTFKAAGIGFDECLSVNLMASVIPAEMLNMSATGCL